MKNFIVFLIFSLFAFPLWANSNEDCPKPIRFGWSEFPPFTQKAADSEDEVSGIDVDLFNLLAVDVGCEVEFVQYKQKSTRDNVWERMIADLKAGKIDVLSSVSKTDERNKFAHFHIPYIQDTNALFMKKDDIKKYSHGAEKINSFMDLLKIPGFKLGVVSGIYNGNEFELAKKNPKFAKIVMEYPDDREIFKAIRNGKINGFLEDIIYTNFKIEDSDLKDVIDIFPMRISNEGIYFAFSRKSFEGRKKIVRDFDSSLKKFIKNKYGNDAFEEILMRYLYENQVGMIRNMNE